MELISNKINFPAILLLVSSISLIASLDSASAQTVSAPDPITDLIAIPGNGEVHLSWSSSYDNGSPIKSYTIIRWETGSDVFTTFPNLGTTTAATAKFTIPQWIKTNTGWWSEGKISDAEYVQAIEYLLNQGIIRIR